MEHAKLNLPVNNLKQQYLLNKLSSETQACFESYVLDKPNIIEDMLLDEIMVKHRKALRPTFPNILNYQFKDLSLRALSKVKIYFVVVVCFLSALFLSDIYISQHQVVLIKANSVKSAHNAVTLMAESKTDSDYSLCQYQSMSALPKNTICGKKRQMR